LTSRHTDEDRERERQKVNQLASNIEHKNPNTKKNEAVEEEKKRRIACAR